jgi:hypothetical protein
MVSQHRTIFDILLQAATRVPPNNIKIKQFQQTSRVLLGIDHEDFLPKCAMIHAYWLANTAKGIIDF